MSPRSYFIKNILNSLNDIRTIVYSIFSQVLALLLGHAPFCTLIVITVTKTIIATCENMFCSYVIQGVKNIFDKVANFLASADIKAFGCTCLFAMLLLIGLVIFYTQGVFV